MKLIQRNTLIFSIAIYSIIVPFHLYSQNIYPLGEGLKTKGYINAIEYDSIHHRIYVGGKFNAIGNVEASNIAYYENGHWYPLDHGVDGTVSTIKVVDADLYVGGYFNNASGTLVNHVAHWNGSEWLGLGSGINDDLPVTSLEWFEDKLYATGPFLKAGGKNINGVAVWDGSQWTDSGLDNFLHAQGLLVCHDTLWAWGSAYQSLAGHHHLASYLTNGQWTIPPITVGFQGPVLNSFLRFHNELYASAGNAIAKWKNGEWNTFSNAPSDKRLQQLFAYHDKIYMVLKDTRFQTNNSLIPVGEFQSIGDIRTANASGFISSVKQIGNDLWLGGDFVEINKETFLSLAIFNGSAWTSIGNTKATGYISGSRHAQGNSITEDGMIVAGDFYYAGDIYSPHIAKWNGVEWKPMGEGFNDPVNQVIIYNNEIYAGGRFTRSGSTPVNHLAKWDGAHWQQVGIGADYSLTGMIVFAGKLYAWGIFHKIGNSASVYFAKFDGTNWKQVYGPWIEDENPISDVAIWDGNLQVTYIWSKPVTITSDGFIKYLGNEALGEGQLFSFKGELYYGGSRILKYEGPGWKNLNFPITSSGYYPHFLEMNDDLYCSYTNLGLFRFDGSSWEYLSHIQPYSVEALGDDKYLTTGFFPYLTLNTCLDSVVFNHTALLEFKPPTVSITSDQYLLCKNQPVKFHAESDALYIDYNWIFEGGIPFLSTDECPVVTYSQTGTYYAKLTATNAAGATTVISTYPVIVTEDCLTGTKPIETDSPGILLYPNPVSDILNIDLKGNKIKEIKIFNLTGVLMTSPILNEVNPFNPYIDASCLPPGVYFITLYLNDRYEMCRFIKI